MRKAKKAIAPASIAGLLPIEKADEGKPLSNARLERAAALLDEIDRLGKELWTVMDGDSGHHSMTTPIGGVLLYVEEGLAVNAETHITPGELAARLRTLISSR